MLTATQNAVGLKDISVSKVSAKGADGQFGNNDKFRRSRCFQTPPVMSSSLSDVGPGTFQASRT